MENREMGNLRFIILTICIILSLCGIIAAPKKSLDHINKSNLYCSIMKWNIPFLNGTILEKEEALKSSKTGQQKTISEILFWPLKIEIPVLNKIKPLIFNVSNIEEETIKDIPAFNLDTGEFKKAEINTEIAQNNAVASVFNPDLIWHEKSDSMQVLIYHTHTCEGYLPGKPQTEDFAYSVVGAAEELSNELRNYGINVIHDKTFHDNVNYNKAYTESGKTLDKYLEKHGDFDLIIDLHRNSVPNKKSVTTNFNGKNLAKLMIVLAKNNPHFNDNSKVADELIKISQDLFPGLFKDELIYNNVIRNKAFNQTKSKSNILIELGAEVNTIDEAKETTKYLARIIAEYLKEKAEEV